MATVSGPYARFPGIVGPGDFNGQGLSTVAITSPGFTAMHQAAQQVAAQSAPQPSPDLVGTIWSALPNPGPLGIGVLAALGLLIYMDRRIL